MKVLLARKDVTLSSTQSVGFEPTSRINDHGLAVRSNTIMGTLQVEPHDTVPITNDQYICLTTHADHVETPGICHIRFKSLHRSQYRLHA